MWKALVFILLCGISLISEVESYECGKPVVRMKKRTEVQRFFNRIVGGWEATPHSFPWQVRVLTHKQGNMYGACGGSLIQFDTGNSTDLVLTAAHCFEDKGRYPSPSKIMVIVGAHNLDDQTESTQKTIKVKDYKYNAFNPKTNANDIALLRLEQAVAHTDATIPVCLPKQGQDIPVGKVCYVSGWGATSENGQSSRLLLQVDAEILNQAVCRNMANPEYMFCAGTVKGGKDSCQGDSGGPLVCEVNGQYYQFGVVSFGVGCARVNYPGVYATVPVYVDWLNAKSKVMIPSRGVVTPGAKSPSTSGSVSGSRPSSGLFGGGGGGGGGGMFGGLTGPLGGMSGGMRPSSGGGRPSGTYQQSFGSQPGGGFGSRPGGGFGSQLPSNVVSMLSGMGIPSGGAGGASGTYTVTSYVNGKPSVQTYRF